MPMTRFHAFYFYVGTFLLLSHGGPVIAQNTKPNYDYDTFPQAVASLHPENSIDKSRIAIANQEAKVAGTLPDPVLSVERSGLDIKSKKKSDMAGESGPMKGWSLGITQNFPWPGTLKDAEISALASSAAVAKIADQSRLQRYLSAQELYLKMALTKDRLTLELAILDEVRNLLHFAEERFRQGVGTHLEVLSTRGELALLTTNIGNIEAELDILMANASLMLDLPLSEKPNIDLLPLKTIVATQANPEKASANIDLARETISEQSTAEIASIREMLSRNLPGFSLSATGSQMLSGERSIAFMAGVSLPIFSTSKRSSLKF